MQVRTCSKSMYYIMHIIANHMEILLRKGKESQGIDDAQLNGKAVQDFLKEITPLFCISCAVFIPKINLIIGGACRTRGFDI